MEWIKIPIGGVVVKNDTQQVARVVVKRGRPVVQCDDCEFYPRDWHGTKKNGEIATWSFPLGPIESVTIHTDPRKTRWVRVVWK